MKKLSTKAVLNNKATPAVEGGNGYDINTDGPIIRPTTFITDNITAHHKNGNKWLHKK